MSKIKKIFLGSMILWSLLAISCYTLFQTCKSRTFQFFGQIIDRVDTDKKIVALTFDDAPTSSTPEILKILAEKNVKATFYVIGRAMENRPDLVRQIIGQDHELGNHSYSHERIVFKSQSYISDEIERTNKLIRDAGYADEITFRPPNGKKLIGLP